MPSGPREIINQEQVRSEGRSSQVTDRRERLQKRAAMALMNFAVTRRAISRVKVAIIGQPGQQCPWPGTKYGNECLMSQLRQKGETKSAKAVGSQSGKLANCSRKSQSATSSVIVSWLQLIIRLGVGWNLHSRLWLSFCDFSSPFFGFPAATAAASAECKTVRP